MSYGHLVSEVNIKLKKLYEDKARLGHEFLNTGRDLNTIAKIEKKIEDYQEIKHVAETTSDLGMLPELYNIAEISMPDRYINKVDVGTSSKDVVRAAVNKMTAVKGKSTVAPVVPVKPLAASTSASASASSVFSAASTASVSSAAPSVASSASLASVASAAPLAPIKLSGAKKLVPTAPKVTKVEISNAGVVVITIFVVENAKNKSELEYLSSQLGVQMVSYPSIPMAPANTSYQGLTTKKGWLVELNIPRKNPNHSQLQWLGANFNEVDWEKFLSGKIIASSTEVQTKLPVIAPISMPSGVKLSLKLPAPSASASAKTPAPLAPISAGKLKPALVPKSNLHVWSQEFKNRNINMNVSLSSAPQPNAPQDVVDMIIAVKYMIKVLKAPEGDRGPINKTNLAAFLNAIKTSPNEQLMTMANELYPLINIIMPPNSSNVKAYSDLYKKVDFFVPGQHGGADIEVMMAASEEEPMPDMYPLPHQLSIPDSKNGDFTVIARVRQGVKDWSKKKISFVGNRVIIDDKLSEPLVPYNNTVKNALFTTINGEVCTIRLDDETYRKIMLKLRF